MFTDPSRKMVPKKCETRTERSIECSYPPWARIVDSMMTVNKNPSSRDLRKFAVAMLIGFGVLGGVAWCAVWLKSRDAADLDWTSSTNQTLAVVFWGLGVLLCAAGLGPRFLARRVYVFWMSVAMAIGAVVTTILLTILFVVLLPWFSVIVRLGDPLRKKLNASGTYWEEYKPYPATMERLQRPF